MTRVLTQEDRRLMETPSDRRAPCGDCVHLRRLRDERLARHYAECTYAAPVRAYWQYRAGPPATWRSVKMIDGPHAPDAEAFECDAHERSAT